MNENVVPATEPYHFILMLIFAIIVITPIWRICTKAGYSGWLSLLMVIPFANLILLYFLAFADWPILRLEKRNDPVQRS
jgi:uncharacterized membrane protein YhaH (DUF805 family)